MEAAQSQPDGTVHEKFLGNHSESAAASQQQSEVQAGMPSTQTGQAQNDSVSTSGVSVSSCPQGLSTGGNNCTCWDVCYMCAGKLTVCLLAWYSLHHAYSVDSIH